MFSDLVYKKEKKYIIDKYFIAEAEDVEELNMIVNGKLKEGYSLNGEPYTDGINHYQPMLKYLALDEETKDIQKTLLFENIKK